MKKLLAFLLFSSMSYSQEAIISFNYGTSNTLNAEILIDTGTFWLGGGFGGMLKQEPCLPTKINEYDRKQTITNSINENWCDIYVNSSFGYIGPIMVSYRTGLSVLNKKVTFNDSYTKIEKVLYKPLIGVNAMTQINKDFGVQVGFDTFNKFTVGFCAVF